LVRFLALKIWLIFFIAPNSKKTATYKRNTHLSSHVATQATRRMSKQKKRSRGDSQDDDERAKKKEKDIRRGFR
jgi:hypothetical protein